MITRLEIFGNTGIAKTEYSLLISPPDSVKKPVMEYKKAVAGTIGRQYPDLHFIPHISIRKFLANEQYEDTLVGGIRNILTYFDPFAALAQGFSKVQPGKKNYYTILVNIHNHEAMVKVMKALHRFITMSGYECNTGSLSPHISVANGLWSSEIDSVWSFFATRTFKVEFFVREITLLKRRLNDVHYNEVCKIPIGRQ